MTRQEALLKKALAERGRTWHHIAIDHPNGVSTVDGTEYGIIYPDSFFDATADMVVRDKPTRYFFRGHLGTGRRVLLGKYQRQADAIVEESRVGRDPDRKDEFDADYFEALARARYGLCPHHPEWEGPPETMWTYRFIDCVLVGAIPVLFHDAPLSDAFIRGFRYVWDGDGRLMTAADAEHNRTLAEERFRL